MLRKLHVAVVAVLTLIVLASCGGGGSATSKTSPSYRPLTIHGHTCTKQDEALQCVLPPAPKNLKLSSGTVRQGIDFAWSCPSPRGQAFGVSYFSPDGSKNWTRGCVNAYHSAGAATVGVYESSQYRAQQGYNAGFTDAYNGRQQARGVGEPDNRPIDFAVDCDCSLGSIYNYFVGIDAGMASILHVSKAQAIALVNVYGGYSQVSGLFNSHLVGHENWQTYAWSGGRWLPASIAPLEQYLNDDSVDYDRAIASNYGQWPATAPAPPPKPKPPADPYHYKIFSKDVHKVAKLGTFSEISAVLHYDGARKHPAKYATFLKNTLKPELLILANQIIKRVNGETKFCTNVATCAPNWSKFNRGERQLLLRARANGTQVAK